MWKMRALILALIAHIACMGPMNDGIIGAAAATQLPLRAIKVTLLKSARDEFVRRIEEFASSNDLDVRVSQSTPHPDDVLIHMWRRDVKMLSVRVPDRSVPGLRYDIAIYTNHDELLPAPVVDRFVNDLRHAIEPIEHATFTILK